MVMMISGKDGTFNLILGIINKVCISISFSISYVYGSELYPTSIRSIGVGFVTFIGKFGAALAPILILLCDKIDINPQASFGIFTLLAFVLALFLKETYKCNLIDQIPELCNESTNCTPITIH